MSENNLNSDEEAPLNGESPDNNPEKNKNPETNSEINKDDSSLSDDNPSGIVSEQNPLPTGIAPVKPKEGNYQISLINKNLLRVIVLSKKGVKINSSVTEKKTSTETQLNEIYLTPKIDFGLQEIEILIEAEKRKVEEIIIPETEHEKNEVSLFKFDTINENLLKIKIVTEDGVKIDSIVRDKKTNLQSQSNRIYLQPKSAGELQEVEIIIEVETVKKDSAEDFRGAADDGKIKLIPNPEVADLIIPPDYSNLINFDPYSTGDYTENTGGFNNPFDAIRKLIKRNLTIGIISAVVLHAAAAGVAFYSISKKQKAPEPEEQSRLIVIQDLPDPKIKLENVEDPNKPKEAETPVITEPDEINERKREITPRKIVKPPDITRPNREREEVKLDSSVDANLTRELDSLRKLLTENKEPDSTASVTDSTGDSVKTAFDIPDSLRNNFNKNDVALAMYFPKTWKLTDQREINKKETEFKGVVLTDTTAEQPGTMTMFIFLDSANKDYNSEDFKTEFKMNDSSLTAFSKDPKTLAGFTEYRFYIFNKLGTEKLSIRASVRKQYYEQYKNEIEAVVRSIKIKKKEDL